MDALRFDDPPVVLKLNCTQGTTLNYDVSGQVTIKWPNRGGETHTGSYQGSITIAVGAPQPNGEYATTTNFSTLIAQHDGSDEPFMKSLSDMASHLRGQSLTGMQKTNGEEAPASTYHGVFVRDSYLWTVLFAIFPRFPDRPVGASDNWTIVDSGAAINARCAGYEMFRGRRCLKIILKAVDASEDGTRNIESTLYFDPVAGVVVQDVVSQKYFTTKQDRELTQELTRTLSP